MVQATAEAPVEVTAAPVDAPPDDAPVLGAPVETESAPAPDATETASDGTETESGPDPLADLTPEQLKEHPAIKAMLDATAKDVEARQAESYRQRQQAAETQAKERADAEAYARNLAELDAVDRGALRDQLYAALNKSIDPTMDPSAAERLAQQLPVLGQMAETLQRTTQTRNARETVDLDNEYLSQNFPEYRVPTEVIAKYNRALSQGDRKAQRTVLNDIIAAAAVEKASPRIASDAVKALKTEAEAALKNTQRQASERAAAQNSGPTNVAGRASNGLQFANRREVALAHSEGRITNQQARQLYGQPLSQLPE